MASPVVDVVVEVDTEGEMVIIAVVVHLEIVAIGVVVEEAMDHQEEEEEDLVSNRY